MFFEPFQSNNGLVYFLAELMDAEAVLLPLDPETDLSSIDGQHVRFLEAK